MMSNQGGREPKVVRLESGDLLVFGGQVRLLLCSL